MGGGKSVIKVLLVALAARMTCWAVGGRRSHPLVSFPALPCTATAGWSASLVYNLVAKSLKILMIPVWFCGEVLVGVGRLVSDHRRNQMRSCLSARRDSGAKTTRGDLTAADWRKAKTSL